VLCPRIAAGDLGAADDVGQPAVCDPETQELGLALLRFGRPDGSRSAARRRGGRKHAVLESFRSFTRPDGSVLQKNRFHFAIGIPR
jgi:hypothetical protein